MITQTTGTALLEPMNQPAYQVNLKAFYNCSNQALIQIQASDDASTDHVPSTVILVIDISGSMGSAASMHDDSDGASGLSQLDIVKHASRTVIESLHEDDQLGVVAFSTDARVVFPLANMNSENREKAWNAVNTLQPINSTNLYDGLIKALELFKTLQEEGRATALSCSNPNVMLLTDGMPNVAPPRGELHSLRNYLDANPSLRKVRIAAFGFGYSLKSQLLADIASLGNSLYAFIPDASFVGTVFINTVSNILACASTSQMTLKLEACNGVALSGISSGQVHQKTQWGLAVDLPSLLYGQTLEVLVQTTGDPSREPFKAYLESDVLEKPLEASPCYIDPMDTEEDEYFCSAQVRSELIQCIREAGRCSTVQQLQKGLARIEYAKQRVSEILSEASKVSVSVEKIKQDLEGQVTEAYSRLDWHMRWGVHYTLALASAHSLQQCSNFKDPGVETYATQKFSLLRDASEAKFVTIPVPKPSRPVRQAVSSMKAYYRSSAPCFATGLVRLADGTETSIRDIKAGDSLHSADGPVLVRCVVATPIKDTVGLVNLGKGVLVTPWHPVRPVSTCSNAKWYFPYQLAAPEWVSCSSVISLVLEDGAPSFQIGDFDAVSLGHGIRGDPVAEHGYLGTDRVLRDLAEMEGWDSGRVLLPVEPVMRDPRTSLIVGMKSRTAKMAAF